MLFVSTAKYFTLEIGTGHLFHHIFVVRAKGVGLNYHRYNRRDIFFDKEKILVVFMVHAF